MAIADATLQYLVQNTKCKTLFITHYPLLAAKLENKFPRDVSNLHMGYIAESRIDGTRNITFLYRLTAGLATGMQTGYASPSSGVTILQSPLALNVHVWRNCPRQFSL